MKILKIKQNIQSKGTNHYVVKYKGKLNFKPGEMFIYSNKKDDFDSAFEVLEILPGKEFNVRKLTPAIYVWTNESYQLNNIYKIGLVNWQSVDSRMKQTDSTGMLQPIQLIEKFELTTYSPEVTNLVEKTIHQELELMSDSITGKSLRVRKNREAFQGDWETVLRPVVKRVIDKICGEVKTTSEFPIQRHYQYSAAQKALQWYLTHDRGWIHWTCGTGKSFGLFWIFKSILETIKSHKNTLCLLVPSKHLIVQTSDDVRLVAEGLGYKVNILKVYSEKDRADATKIAAALNTAHKDVFTIVVSTYQSYDTVTMGLKASKLDSFDVMVGDEIHKTSGEEGKLFQKAVRKIKAKKRLYMTASPVKYIENDYGYSGQENEALYGQCFHSYGFLEAQFDGYITPVEIHGLTCSSERIEELKKLIDYKGRVIPSEDGWDIHHSNFTYWLMLNTTLNALKNKLITHPIIYTNKVARGHRFQEDLIKLAKKLGLDLTYANTKVLSGEDKVEDRVKYIKNIFSKQPMSVLINSRCLQEGISASKADSVIIIDPRHSAADLVQILGRPVRLDPDNEDKVAKIFLPMVVEKNEEGKIVFNETKFADTRDWLTAIASADSDFANYFAYNENAIKVDWNAESRSGISYKEVKDPDAPILPSPNDGEAKDPKAPYEFDSSILKDLMTETFITISSQKVKQNMTKSEVATKSVCAHIHDHIMKEIQSGMTYLDKFDTKQRKKYASFIQEDTAIMIEEIISKSGASKEDIEECLTTYFKEVERLKVIKKQLKLKLINEYILA